MDSKISTSFIIKMLQLPRIGKKTAFKLLSNCDIPIESNEDLIEFLQSRPGKLKLPNYSDIDFQNAFMKADQILLESDKQHIKIISYFEDEYPRLLKDIPDFPLILNYKGNLNSVSDQPTVAIIGTRNGSDFGLKYGRKLAEKCAEQNFNIVSGLASGCDTAGHLGALDTNGKTTAILAHGLDSVYPAENKNLAQKILEKDGLLLSEYFVGTKGLPNYFIERDRIQAGLSFGTIVIETDIKGGTMHTVNHTLDYGRKLACVDFPTETNRNLNNEGNKMLIKQGKAISLYAENELISFLDILTDKFKTWTRSEIKTDNLELFPSGVNEIDEKQKEQDLTKEKVIISNSQQTYNESENENDIEIFLKSRLEAVNQQIEQKTNEIKKLKNEKKRIEKRLGITSTKSRKSPPQNDEKLF